MGIFSNPTAAATTPQSEGEATPNSSLLTPNLKSSPTGLDLHLPYHPTDKVWTIVGGKAVELRILRIMTEHRSLMTENYQPVTTISILLENSVVRSTDEVFTTKEELINSL